MSYLDLANLQGQKANGGYQGLGKRVKGSYFLMVFVSGDVSFVNNSGNS